MPYYKTLQGKKCFLSPISLESVERYTQWFNDLEMSKNLITVSQMITLEGEKAFVDDMVKKGQYVFDIVTINDDVHIGNVGLFDIDQLNGIAELGVAIGDKNYWSKGYGTEALQLLCDYGFNILNLKNIMLRYYEYNTRGGRCYEKVGFKYIGKRRNAKTIAGKSYNIVYMDLCADEFESPYVKSIVEGK